MQMTKPDTADASPFHAGEQELQARVGKREKMDIVGRQVIRPYMPDQHRLFFSQLPFLVVGSVDEAGWPWASILAGHPGFVSSPEPKSLRIDAVPLAGDPLTKALHKNAQVGVLGIEVPTRRRNRMNGRITASDQGGFTIGVDQSFGNCPQYIQTRRIDFVRDPNQISDMPTPSTFTDLDDAAQKMIRSADTFFVASYAQSKSELPSEGADVSHRGGRVGFVKVEGNTLTIPDYSGNDLFNTLGNFLVNPKAGLIFTDFTTGDLLSLTGSVEVLSDDAPEVRSFKGAERAWRFTLDHGVKLSDALPFRAAPGEVSNNTLITGDWEEAARIMAAEAKRNAWRPYRVSHVEDESSVIRSFYLEPADGDGLLPFEAGQFLTLRTKPDAGSPATSAPLVRTYTVSSAPGDPYYRLSIKREPGGAVSNYFHDHLKPGDEIEAKAPSGDFYIDAAETRPAVLLAGGVGVTPMIAMATHIANEGVRTRHLRPLTILHAAQTTEQRAFARDFRVLENQSKGAIRYRSFISRADEQTASSHDDTFSGYITTDALRDVLALDDYDFYLCGPGAFMQNIYDSLRTLGVRDARIYAEAFGPASLIRQADEGGNSIPTYQSEEADHAMIKFAKSKFEQPWIAGGETLLETAEAHGLTPEYGCRSGSCGSCRVALLSGAVAYRTAPSAEHADDEVLICCAVPAKGSDAVEIDL